jgi:hypothetical protein
MTSARAAAAAAALLAVATLAIGLHYGSTTAGGADSYGYVSGAGLWLQGRLTLAEPIARESPWPLAIETWAPLAYRPAPGRTDAIVPVYSQGLPLLMAAFQAVGGFCAAFVVVPLCGALTVWLTYVLGTRIFAAPTIALGSALLVASSPIFLYQLMNPMSDVPVTAAWTLSLVLAASDWPLAAGLAAGAALIIRPNLAAIAVALFAWLLLATPRRAVRFAVGLAPALVAIATMNAIVYGAPWLSGYGTLNELYMLSNLATNARQFSMWLIETQTPAVVLALVFFAARRLAPEAIVPHARVLLGAVLAAVWLSYLFYIPFDAWWYLRFLLPAWPAMLLLMAAVIVGLVHRLVGPRLAAPIAWIAIAALTANGVRVAAARFAFDIGRTERHYLDVARFVSRQTEPSAVFFSLQHSGALRMYAARRTLRFDHLDGAWLDRAVAFLHASGRHPYFVLEGGEVEMFKKQFGAANALGRLDWPPLATMTTAGDVSVYDPLARGATVGPLSIAATASRRVGWRCDPPPTWPPRALP